MDSEILPKFNPLVQQWFDARFADATDIQRASWKAISGGSHCLICAPTGSGKTLAAFLWAVNGFIDGSSTGRILYISPLKALNNDIQKNLMTPLAEIREQAGEGAREVRVAVRSGDSSSTDRNRILRHPPDIFITTPESLNIMLTSDSGRKNLTDISTVILDEIHVVAGSKRGSLLMVNIERLESLRSADGAERGLHRIGISATIKPIERVAAFLGGSDSEGAARPVSIIRDIRSRGYSLAIKLGEKRGEGWWDRQIPLIAEEIRSHRSSLIFCNSRRSAEKASYLLNEYLGQQQVFAHHGSLSREYRYWIEQELKDGRLRAVCATSSLELGIDVGSIDNVVILQAPFSISSAIQRVGRANHQVGQISKAVFAPLHPRDIAKSLALIREILLGNMEEIRIPRNSQDIIAQVIVSECAGRRGSAEELYSMFRRSYSFADLERTHFESILEMLAGKYQNTRMADLGQRIIRDGDAIEGREGLRMLIYQGGGTIPDRGYFDLRIQGSGEKIGELDEEFVFERSLGDRFSLGNRVWQIVEMDNQQVRVTASSRSAMIAPFWKADNLGSDPWTSRALNRLYSDLDADPEAVRGQLPPGTIENEAWKALTEWVLGQKETSGAPLPGSDHLLVEMLYDPSLTPDMAHCIIHSGWGISVNAPLMYCLRELHVRSRGTALQSYFTDEAVVCSIPLDQAADFTPRDLLEGILPGEVPQLLWAQLLGSGIFGARFRANSGRSLLVVRRGFNARTPLWVQRMRSKQLLEAVSDYPDFPIIRETWRELLEDDFAIDDLKDYLGDIRDDAISLSVIESTKPSPFASDLMWDLNNEYLYADDSLESISGKTAGRDMLKDLLGGSYPMPEIPEEVQRDYLLKRRRLYHEYRPEDEEDFRFYVNDRRILTNEEREELIALTDDAEGLLSAALEDFHVRSPAADKRGELSLHRDLIHDYQSAGHGEGGENLDSLVMEWMDWQAFVDRRRMTELWGEETVERLLSAEQLLEWQDRLISPVILERLIRITRRWKRSRGGSISAGELQFACAVKNAIVQNPISSPTEEAGAMAGHRAAGDAGPAERTEAVLDALSGFSCRPETLARDILLTRLGPGAPASLESAFINGGFFWTGDGSGAAFIAHESDASLYGPPEEDAVHPDDGEAALVSLLYKGGRFGIEELRIKLGWPSAELRTKIGSALRKGLLCCDSPAALERYFALGMLHTEAKNRSNESRGPEIPEAPLTQPGLPESRLPESGLPESGLPHAGLPERGLAKQEFHGAPTRKPDRPPSFHHLKRRRRQAPGPAHSRLPGRVYIPLSYSADDSDTEPDPGEVLADAQYRIFQVLQRRSIVSRENLGAESKSFLWKDLLPVLRNLELSGELIGGKICPELPGLQFCLPELLSGDPGSRPARPNAPAWFWLNSYDPAWVLPGFPLRRGSGSYGIFISSNGRAHLAIAVGRRGADIVFAKQPEENDGKAPAVAEKQLCEILAGFYREVLIHPERGKNSARIELIDGAPAAEHRLSEVLQEQGFLLQSGALIIWRY